MKLIEALPYLVREEEPKMSTHGTIEMVNKAKAEHRKTWNTIESLEWKNIANNPPLSYDAIYIKQKGKQPYYVEWRTYFEVQDDWQYIETSIYEEALAQEKKLCALGDDWRLIKGVTYFGIIKGELKLHLIGGYFSLWEIEAKSKYEVKLLGKWHESICEVQMVLDVIKQIEI